MMRDTFDEEPDWKVVGSRSRRESFSVGRVLDGVTSNNNHATASLSQTPSLINQKQQPEFRRRGSTSSERQWGSFGGLQWEGPSIFDEDTMPATNPPLFTSTPDQYHDSTTALTTPMLPNVPVKPVFREQRSFSFSMGQDSTLFGYDNYNSRNTNSFLSPTLEEEEENDQLPSFDDVYLRSRSQSSNTTFGTYPAGHWMNMNRRASLGFINSSSSTSSDSFIDSSKDLLSQRRMSQPLTHIVEYSFPEIIPNGGATHSGNQTTSIGQLSDYLEISHIHRSTSSSILPNHASHIIPETSSNATVIPNQQQQQAQDTTAAGKGLLLQQLPPHIPLFMIEFKSGRTGFYYNSEPSLKLRIDDLVLVEADRGRDLGKVATDVLTVDQVLLLQQQQQQNSSNRLIIDQEQTDEKKVLAADSYVKKVYKIAGADEIRLLLDKEQDEQKALAVCLQKVKNRKLSMEVVDAEFQWDRRKLTFYFIAERRIDFRELVRELFKIYKTRIWMCAVNPTKSSFSA
ncbi:hypothetical protein [Parasitella parasitica]|uniref:PSP1 C-terminal domain-containing protein n=1 Tax=Parasitella parasitica TaxID=35722 RepID=A0A0B7MUK2_9FUNG|nr:hypothetical protein [Parasitella parasitica]